jgi:hypothetical protein
MQPSLSALDTHARSPDAVFHDAVSPLSATSVGSRGRGVLTAVERPRSAVIVASDAAVGRDSPRSRALLAPVVLKRELPRLADSPTLLSSRGAVDAGDAGVSSSVTADAGSQSGVTMSGENGSPLHRDLARLVESPRDSPRGRLKLAPVIVKRELPLAVALQPSSSSSTSASTVSDSPRLSDPSKGDQPEPELGPVAQSAKADDSMTLAESTANQVCPACRACVARSASTSVSCNLTVPAVAFVICSVDHRLQRRRYAVLLQHPHV